jgi:predicted dehydrogenase
MASHPRATARTIRVGVVGAGFGRQVHVPAFRAEPRCQVVAIAASTRERAQAAAGMMGIEKAFGSWRDMVEDEEIEAISIATPPGVQAHIARAAIDRRKAVFCEKPLAVTEADAREMSAAADRAGVANMVDFEFPEVAEWQRAKALIDGGGIGPLRQIAVHWSTETYANREKLNSWKTRTEDGGGTLGNFVSHVFYYLEWLAGPILEVSARLFRAPDDGRAGDSFDALALRFESGAACAVSVNAAAFPGSGHRVELYGETGAIWLENVTADYMSGFRLLHGTRNSGRMEQIAGGAPLAGVDGRIAAVSRLTSRFADWIDKGTAANPDFRSGLRVQQLISAARRSHEAGGRLEEVPPTRSNHL